MGAYNQASTGRSSGFKYSLLLGANACCKPQSGHNMSVESEPQEMEGGRALRLKPGASVSEGQRCFGH